jgi:heme exporter protein D
MPMLIVGCVNSVTEETEMLRETRKEREKERD